MFKTDYGYFRADGKAYIITRPDTPRPWVNVLANERYGTILSQAGGGFSWLDHSALSVLTRWEMDLVRDPWGKWIYIKDEASGELWSAAPQPTLAKHDAYECEHGLGYTCLRMQVNQIETEWTTTVPPDSQCELWQLKITNRSRQVRRLSVSSYLAWCLGAAPDSKREFHRLFINTEYSPETGLITATKNLWDFPSEEHGHWNTPWPHYAYHAVWLADGTVPAGLSAQGDLETFLGRHGDWKSPEWLRESRPASGGFGRFGDAIGALACPLILEPGAEITLVFALGCAADAAGVARDVEQLRQPGTVTRALEAVAAQWEEICGAVQVQTEDAAFDLLNNSWLAYQTIAGRLWGRTGYWQQSGAYGFRDQLQDSQIHLTRDPALTLAQLRLHARHQFADGTVYHWWHPLTEVGHTTKMTDDLLWLPFVLTAYLKETDDFAALETREPYVDVQAPASLWEHCVASIECVLARFSPRGLPLIGAGDWNDGLSACGLEWKGESIWLAHFLYGVLIDWVHIARRQQQEALANRWAERAQTLRKAVNEHSWDGEWYWRATLDSGEKIGSRQAKEGKIFLNAQTWAVINQVADRQRANRVMDAVEEHLVREYGPLLFTPAYTQPNERIGYLTRYAPGSRENGGVYTHAATWAIQAACVANRPELAWRLFCSFAPPLRGMDPEKYTVEPYVTPGNVDGPDSPYFGRGGWTWYTGSAGWLHKICIDWIMGVRAEWDGLVIQPCIPAEWTKTTLRRKYRGDIFEITIRKDSTGELEANTLTVDGQVLAHGTGLQSSGRSRLRKVDLVLAACAYEAV